MTKEKNHKLEKKVKTVAGIRDIGIELKFGDLFESYTVTTVKPRIRVCAS